MSWVSFNYRVRSSISDTDSDLDGTPDCNDNCPNDPNKTELGVCGYGTRCESELGHLKTWPNSHNGTHATILHWDSRSC